MESATNDAMKIAHISGHYDLTDAEVEEHYGHQTDCAT